MKIKYLILITTILLNACSNINDNNSKHSNNNLPVQAETFVDLVTERVSFSIDKDASLEDLKEWLKNDRPDNAELNCDKTTLYCKKFANELVDNQIPYKTINDKSNNVIFNYSKISARDCTNLYNQKNTFILGCSNANNILGMVSDYQQFVNPNLLGVRDAAFPTQNYNNLYNISLQNME